MRFLVVGGHHWQRGKTTAGSALDGAVLDLTQILAYLVCNMSRSQLYLGFGHFGWLPSFWGQLHFGGFMVELYFICWNYSLSSGWHIIAAYYSVLKFSEVIADSLCKWIHSLFLQRFVNLMGALTFLLFFFNSFFFLVNCGLYIVCYLSEGR